MTRLSVPTLTIGISTISKNKKRALSIFEKINYKENIDLIIVSQGETLDRDWVHVLPSGLKVLVSESNSLGLSRSRNDIIDKSSDGYVWFLDDDVLLTDDGIDIVLRYIEKSEATVLLGRIGCSDCDGFYKDYSRSRAGLRGALRASSIEVVVDVGFVKRNSIAFDERLGLGALYPSGEENAFLLSMLRRSASFKEIPYFIVKHPCLIEERSATSLWKNKNILISKGILCSYAGFCAPFLLVYFLMKAFWVTRKGGALFYVLKGYLIGR